jgi:hypothetical protein
MGSLAGLRLCRRAESHPGAPVGRGTVRRFGDIVVELVRLKADVIVAPGDLIPRAAKAITTTVPIVMVTSTDPVREGLVQSVGRPGGNVTGLTLTAGPEIEAKRLEFLREVLPRLSRVAYLASKEDKDWENPLGEKPSDGGSGLGCDARPDAADPQVPSSL